MAKYRTPALFAALLVVLATLAAPAARADGFFSNIEDLPVMPGLSEMPGTAVAFDKAEGRIAEVGATGRLTQDQVLEFYRKTLPHLGWKEIAPGRFARDDERLQLDFSLQGTRLTVSFSLSPG